MAYPDDGDCFYVVLETLRLLAGIGLSHDVDRWNDGSGELENVPL